jgi:hypothetical protein
MIKLFDLDGVDQLLPMFQFEVFPHFTPTFPAVLLNYKHISVGCTPHRYCPPTEDSGKKGLGDYSELKPELDIIEVPVSAVCGDKLLVCA